MDLFTCSRSYAILLAVDTPAWFIPDRDPSVFYPLHSFLNRPPASVVEAYLTALTAPGDLVIDPFASTPTVACAAHKLGRRVIAVESNPLFSWLARTVATLPPPPEMNAALTELGDAIKDEASLRAHISQLYSTTCAGCHQLTPATFFIWARGIGPVRRHYVCAHCGETYDGPASDEDREQAARFDPHGFHYHFAFQRIAPEGNRYDERTRKILDLYTPRNLYALVTLTVKIDTLFHARRERDLLLLLLLHLLDRGSSFYNDPAADATAQLKAHKEFVELNLWTEMEQTVHRLAEIGARWNLTLSPSTADVILAEHARVFMGRGSAKALGRAIPSHTATCVLTAGPQRRLAVWALSYFWGAWVLGRSAVKSLVPALDTHKGDPNWERRWYADLLETAMEALAKLLHSEGRAAFIFREAWHEPVEALLLSAARVGFDLETMMFQPALGDCARREFDSVRGNYRISFVPGGEKGVSLSEGELARKMRKAAYEAGRDVLTRRGEPLTYSWLHLAAFTRLAREGFLAQTAALYPKTGPGRFAFSAVREGLTEGYAQDIDHYSTADQFLWLRRVSAATLDPPLVDRVDDAVREILFAGKSATRQELEDAIYRRFPGDLTPEAGLIDLCAQAYAVQAADQAHDKQAAVWQWREEDPEQEKAHALEQLADLGERLQYRVAQSAPFDLTWEAEGEMAHGFVWRSRAYFGDLTRIQIAPSHGYLIIPEARVPLLQAKVRQLPTLAEAFHDAGWGWVRLPFVDKLLEQEKVERQHILLITGLVPPAAEEQTQLELFRE